MAVWDVDLTTRAGINSALHQASIGSFIFCGAAALGVASGVMIGLTTPQGLSVAVAAGVEFAVGLIAGFRLRAGKGLYWSMAAMALLAIELAFKLITLQIGIGLILGGIAIVFMVNGIRASLALKRGVSLDDEDYEVFS